MTSKRLPDRVHVVRPPSEDYADRPVQSMGDHTREIVRALAQISDKLKRNEVEREEMFRELQETRRSLAKIEDKTEASEKAYLSIENKLKNRDAIEGEMTARQLRFEKNLKVAEEKLVKTAAGQAILDQKIKDNETRHATLHERIDEAVTHQTRFDRRLEAISQDKSRMLRKVERLEEVVSDTQDALKAKAMVLLTDQSVAAQSAAALQAPSWFNSDTNNDNAQGMALPWWRNPGRMQALATGAMVIAALLIGWMINQVQRPNVPQIAVLEGGSLAQLNSKTEEWEPIVSNNQPVPSARLSQLDQIEEQQTNNRLSRFQEQNDNRLEPVLEEPVRQQQREPETEAVSSPLRLQPQEQIPEEEPFDYTNDEQLMAALEEDPERLAANLNAIEPGVQKALDLDDKPEPRQREPRISETVTPAAPIPLGPDAFQQDPQIANLVRRDRGLEPLSQRAVRDSTLPSLLQEYEEQAIRGVASAQHDLAAVYTAGRGGVPQDFEKASFWFHEAAANNIPNASYNLGVLYHQGLGVEQDIKKALYWYREAARQDHPEAQYNLGIAHIEGIGTEYDPQLASAFFERAATSGIMEAAYNLGLIYENGLLGQANNEEALYWYKQAADNGSQEANNALNQLAGKLQVGAEDIDALVERLGSIRNSAQPSQANGAPASLQQQASYNREQAIIAQIQERLFALGYYPGPTDGIIGPKTTDAIRTYQAESGLTVSGKPDQKLLEHLLQSRL